MKLTEEQRELIALIPKAIRKSKEYTDATKLVLGQIDFMHGTDFAEVNGYVFCSNDKMSEETDVSVSQVKRVVKILVNEGLITTQRGNRTKEGKEASKYWLTDLYYELANRPKPKNEPLIGGQNESEEKNEPLDIELELEPETDINNMLEYTCTGEDNSKNQHNMKIDERLITEDEKNAWEVLDISDNFDYSQHEDISEMVRSDAVNIGMMENPTYFEKKKNNEYVSKVFRKLSYYIKEYKESTFVETANDWGCKVNNVYDSLDRSLFKEAQWKVISKMMDEFDYLFECKEKFLSKKYHKPNITKKTVSNANIISTGTSDSEHCPSPAAASQNTKEEYLNALRKVFIEEEGWTLKTFYAKSGFGLYDYRKKVADILGVNVDRIDCYKFEKDIKAMLSNDMMVEEPMVAYGNNSVKEAQEQFAMALAANG